MWGLLRGAGVIALFVLAPGMVVWGQMGFVQVIAKLGEVEADQGSFGSRPEGGENPVLVSPSPTIPTRMRRFRKSAGFAMDEITE